MTATLQAPPAGLEEAVADGVRSTTHGNISRLDVRWADGVIVVRGETRTYYLKQLALEGAKAALTRRGRVPLKFNVVVAG